VHTGEVQRFVEVARIARALAEVGDDDVVGFLHLEGEAETGRDRQARSQHARIAENAQRGHAAVQRRVAPFRQPGGLGEHLRHHHLRLDPLHQKRSEVAVQRADEILFPQPEAGADDDGFLTDAGVDAAADFALLDEDGQAFVERADQLEPVEHLEQLLGRELELRAFDGRHGQSIW
jgi:hypothetical protein